MKIVGHSSFVVEPDDILEGSTRETKLKTEVLGKTFVNNLKIFVFNQAQ